MKPETKKNIKETLEDMAVVAMCILLVVMLNRQCMSVINKDTKQKLETYKVQNQKIITSSFGKLQKNR